MAHEADRAGGRRSGGGELLQEHRRRESEARRRSRDDIGETAPPVCFIVRGIGGSSSSSSSSDGGRGGGSISEGSKGGRRRERASAMAEDGVGKLPRSSGSRSAMEVGVALASTALVSLLGALSLAPLGEGSDAARHAKHTGIAAATEMQPGDVDGTRGRASRSSRRRATGSGSGSDCVGSGEVGQAALLDEGSGAGSGGDDSGLGLLEDTLGGSRLRGKGGQARSLGGADGALLDDDLGDSGAVADCGGFSDSRRDGRGGSGLAFFVAGGKGAIAARGRRG